MASYTGCEPGFFPFTYLGLPIGSNMSRIANWRPLIDHFKARLSGWKANHLSIGGRLTLIKSVLDSLVLSIQYVNRLLKWRWMSFHNTNALWVHVVKAIHGDEAAQVRSLVSVYERLAKVKEVPCFYWPSFLLPVEPYDG
ncbi:hypothetical protein Tco_0713863 [Tanacetum coccineum]